MREWGRYLMRIGLGAFLLPLFGLQFRGMSVFGESLPLIAAGMAGAGVTLLGLSYRRRS
jgi:hypothetical protein